MNDGRRRFGALAMAGVLAAGLAACGDDDGGGDAVGLEDVEGGEDSTDTTVDLGDVGDIAGLSAECQVLVQAGIAFASAFGGTGDEDFGDLAEAMEEFAGDAPEEIRDDVTILARAYAEFAERLGDVDFSDPEAFNDPELVQRMSEASAIFEEPEVAEASANVEAFSTANCEADGG